MQPLPYLFMAPILLWAAWTDVRHMRTSNAAVFAAVMIFVLSSPLVGWSEAGLRLCMAVAIFAAGFALFALRIVRGGDVKMAAALMLFVPTDTYALFAFHVLLTVIGVVALVRGLRMVAMTGPDPSSCGRADDRFPISFAVASSGVLHMAMLRLIW